MNYIKIALSLSILCALPAQAMVRIAKRAATFRAPCLAAAMPRAVAASIRSATARIAAAASSTKTPARSLASPAKKESIAANKASMPFAGLKAGFKGNSSNNSQNKSRSNFGKLFIGAGIAFAATAKTALAQEDTAKKDDGLTDTQIAQRLYYQGQYTPWALNRAIWNDDLESIKEMCTKCPYLVNEPSSEGIFGAVPLMCSLAKPAVVALLIKLGANINYKDPLGRTALHMLVVHGFSTERSIESIKLLLTAKAETNIQDNELNTPLHNTFDPRVINLLLDAGANPNLENRETLTPLAKLLNNYSFPCNHDLAVEALLNSDKVNQKDIKLNNLNPERMCSAIGQGLLKTVKFFIEHSDLNIRTNNHGRTAMGVALQSQGPNKEAMIKLLNDELIRTQK